MNANTLIDADDEISFQLSAFRTITQEDVRVSVAVTALVSVAHAHGEALEHRIREALNRLIKADWAFSQIRRSGEAVGFERVNLTAWARVPHAQVFNLGERARQAGEEGLALSTPEVDYGLPAARIDELAHELRGELLTRISAQLADYERWTGRRWRIGKITLGANGDGGSRHGMYRMMHSDNTALSMRVGESLSDDEGNTGVAGSERIGLSAEVTLRSGKSSDRS
jgi:hypothetical protein